MALPRAQERCWRTAVRLGYSLRLRLSLVGFDPKRSSTRTLPLIFAFLCASMLAATTKPVIVFVEGDSSVVPKFINVCRQMGPERGLEFLFVDKKEDRYDYRVVLSGEGSSVWNFAQGNIVVLNPEAKVIFTVTRSNRWTAKGATNALTK